MSLCGCQIPGGRLSTFCNELVLYALTLGQRPHAGALHSALVHEDILRAVFRLYESKPSSGVKKLHGSNSHFGLQREMPRANRSRRTNNQARNGCLGFRARDIERL